MNSGFGAVAPNPSIFGQPQPPTSPRGSGFGPGAHPQISAVNVAQQSEPGGFVQPQGVLMQSAFGGTVPYFGTSGVGQAPAFGQQHNEQDGAPNPTSIGFNQPHVSLPQGFGGFEQPSGTQTNGVVPSQPQQSQFHPGRLHTQQVSNGTDSGPGGPRPDNVIHDRPIPKLPQLSVPNGRIGQPDEHGDVSSYTRRDENDRLLAWKGRPVRYLHDGNPHYQTDDGEFERIWFPNGPPTQSQSNSMSDVDYPTSVVEAYAALKNSGGYLDGVVPEVAPSLEMIRWDV